MRRWLGVGVALWLTLALWAGVTLGQSPYPEVTYYYVGPGTGPVALALERAQPYLRRVETLEAAQVVVLDGQALPVNMTQAARARILEERLGLVLFCGPQFPRQAADLYPLLDVMTFEVEVLSDIQSLKLGPVGEQPDVLQKAIAWTSAPQAGARTEVKNPNLFAPLVVTEEYGPVVQRLRGRMGAQVFVVGLWLNDASNAQWLSWPYFDYLVYRLVAEAGQAGRLYPFADYPLSPVPKSSVRLGIALLGTLILVVGGTGFLAARRYAYLHPEAARARLRSVGRLSVGEGWEEVGFHRPLAGFIYITSLGLVLLLPLLAFRVYILPHLLVPWPQVVGFWELTVRWFEVFWLVFDLGTGLAAVRYFSMLRVNNPREGFQYFQFYVWWQFFSGTVQVAVIAWLAATYFPDTALAHLGYYFIAHAIIQFPGFLRVFGLFFRAAQRLDYEQGLTLVATLGPLAFQSIAVLALRRWGAGIAGIGEPIGAVLGLGAGLYLTEWAIFLIGLGLYKHLGYSLKPLFLPFFDGHVARRALSFGARLTFGALAVPLGHFAQTALIAAFLVNYGEVNANWAVAFVFTTAYGMLYAGLYDGLMPAMAQAYTQGYLTLVRYYIAQAFRYGMWFSVFILAALGAVAERVIGGALGAPYARAAELVFPLLLWGALQWPAWAADRTLEAVGRPALRSWLTLGEQVLRLGLMFLLIQRWQIWGLLIAYLVALPLKGMVAWLIIMNKVVRARIYVWQTVVAPLLSGALLYGFLHALSTWLWEPTLTSSAWLLVLALVPTLPLYGFLTALAGGWDRGTLAELCRTVAMSGPAYPFAWLLYQGVRFGAKLSPLHGRFPMAIRPLAEEEARALTLRRIPLD